MKEAKAQVHMTGAQLDAALKKCDFTQMGFSRYVGVGGRTVRGWIGGDFPVPKMVAVLVRLMVKHKVTMGEIEP